jgi:hypothetical protein
VGLLALPTSPLRAQNDGRVGAQECCLQLNFPIGARAVSLGNALTSRGGSDALFLNPAGLASIQRDEFRIHSAPTELETSTAFSIAVRIRNVGAAALTYRLVDYGETEAVDSLGFPIGTIQLLDHVLIASFGTTLATGLNAGVSYTLFSEQTGITATTHGIDAGIQYHPPLWPSLQLGASIVHLGFPLQVINAQQASPLPTRIRVGAAYEVMHHFSPDSTTALWATVDGSGSLHEGAESEVGGGLELVVDKTIFVRAGYLSGAGRTAGAAVGVGLQYDRFDIGIAQTFVSTAAGGRDTFQVTLAIGF